MSALPKQTHSDLFFKSHVAGQAFHTHAVIHYTGSVSSLVHSHAAFSWSAGRATSSALNADETQSEY